MILHCAPHHAHKVRKRGDVAGGSCLLARVAIADYHLSSPNRTTQSRRFSAIRWHNKGHPRTPGGSVAVHLPEQRAHRPLCPRSTCDPASSPIYVTIRLDGGMLNRADGLFSLFDLPDTAPFDASMPSWTVRHAYNIRSIPYACRARSSVTALRRVPTDRIL